MYAECVSRSGGIGAVSRVVAAILSHASTSENASDDFIS